MTSKSVLTKKDWLLLALDAAPLDRLRLMKALFLIWLERGRAIPAYFDFVPYLYGPCSFEVYSILSDLEQGNLVVQPPAFPQSWAAYYLTGSGREAAKDARRRASAGDLRLVREWATFAAQKSFNDLLSHVYSCAPEFASNSVARDLMRTQR